MDKWTTTHPPRNQTPQMPNDEAMAGLRQAAHDVIRKATLIECFPGPCACPKCEAIAWANKLHGLVWNRCPGQGHAFDMMELNARRAGIWM